MQFLVEESLQNGAWLKSVRTLIFEDMFGHAFLKLIREVKEVYFIEKSSLNTELNGVILEQ